MDHWQADYDRTEVEVEAQPAGHTMYPERVDQWQAFFVQYGYLPSILLTADGWMVNGHHRLQVARLLQCRLHGLIVERDGKRWVATGNLCLVK